jgi:hypothetical protein
LPRRPPRGAPPLGKDAGEQLGLARRQLGERLVHRLLHGLHVLAQPLDAGERGHAA